MNPKPDSTRVLSRAAATPNIDALRSELETILAQAGSIRDRQTRSQNTRLNRWEGQSDDYRKWDDDTADGVAKPFNGAPDQRVPTVDTAIRQRVALFVTAVMSGEIQAQPLGGLDHAENATKMSRVLRWLRQNVMPGELMHEAELLANYVEGDDPGVGLLKICWHRRPALEMRELTLDEVGLMLLEVRGIVLPEGDPAALQLYAGAIEEVGDLLFNLTREEEALEALQLAFPTVKRRPLLRQALKQLRRTQATELPLPYVKENRPRVAALRYMHDVFYPSDLDDPKNARVIYEREWVSESELRSRVHSEGYDPGWVEDLLDAGPGSGEVDGYAMTANTWARIDGQSVRYGDAETDKLYEVWHAYTRAADDYGIEGIYWTVFSHKVEDAVGYHELLGYPDGEFPYVIFRAEIIARGTENVRGTAERLGSMQSDIKLQRDCRGAHTMLATIPPVRVTQRRGGLESVLGPMVEVPVRESDDVTWMNPPQFPAASIEMERAVRQDLDEYLGRPVNGVSNALSEVLLQFEASRWVNSWVLSWAKIMQLQQEFGDTVEMQLVAGGPVYRYTREEIRGRFAISLTFNVRDLNTEFVIARNQAIGAILAQDIGGLVDRTVIVRAGLRGIDPSLAEQAIRDPQVVTQKEIEDERMMVNMLANGIEAPLRQTGINAQLRLETLERTVNGSPILAQRMMQPSTPADQYFAKLIENRRKNLQFLVQQYGAGEQSNRAIGMKGTAPLQLGAGVASQPA